MATIPSTSNFAAWQTSLQRWQQNDERQRSTEAAFASRNTGLNPVQSRKSAAAARMAQLKQRIESMLRFAHIGKGNPREVAALAKELKALVAQYGGASAGTNASSNLTLNANQSAEATTTDAAHAEAQAAQEQASAQSKAAESKAAETASAASKLAYSQGKGDAGDAAFLGEAKKLSQLLKHLLAQENRKLKTEQLQRDFKAAKQALTDVDDAIKAASQASGSPELVGEVAVADGANLTAGFSAFA